MFVNKKKQKGWMTGGERNVVKSSHFIANVSQLIWTNYR
jgi:hypothetical protein